MAGFPNYSSTPLQNLVGVVQNPVANQNPDGTVGNVALGRQGDLLVSEVHGKWYNAVSRGNVFSAIKHAGSLVLAPAQTTSGMIVYNPVGSGVNMEMIEFSIGAEATTVIGALSVEFGVVPTAVGTAITVNNMLLNGGLTAKGKAATGSTIAAMVLLHNIGTMVSVADVQTGLPYSFDGKLVLPPGSAAGVVSTVTQSTNSLTVSWTWAEHLI